MINVVQHVCVCERERVSVSECVRVCMYVVAVHINYLIADTIEDAITDTFETTFPSPLLSQPSPTSSPFLSSF